MRRKSNRTDAPPQPSRTGTLSEVYEQLHEASSGAAAPPGESGAVYSLKLIGRILTGILLGVGVPALGLWLLLVLAARVYSWVTAQSS